MKFCNIFYSNVTDSIALRLMIILFFFNITKKHHPDNKNLTYTITKAEDGTINWTYYTENHDTKDSILSVVCFSVWNIKTSIGIDCSRNSAKFGTTLETISSKKIQKLFLLLMVLFPVEKSNNTNMKNMKIYTKFFNICNVYSLYWLIWKSSNYLYATLLCRTFSNFDLLRWNLDLTEWYMSL